ncbi:MAG TPA: pseudouridine synthase [Candidatus Dormibacteraeota bacterium]|nr:pseudouridine synthase [Candidatus Dormibacteraeota bacterium]
MKKSKPSKNKSAKNDVQRVGLARALSKMGYCSRSEAAELIQLGRVKLNGSVARNPEAPVRLGKDGVDVDGQKIEAGTKIYLVLNKPRGVITTAEDEKDRDTVYSLLPPDTPWVGPVGRLDKASEGMLLLTNDSEWAARVTAPETHLAKIYHVQISVVADAALLAALQSGVVAKDGETLRVSHTELLRSGEKNSWLEITLHEGKNRHLRRMFEARGIEVLRLIRVAIGPVALADLAKGQSRSLAPTEKLAIDLAMRK